ncbi:hypothetical protein [Chitinophaga cymbidii]|uniref:Uncharacterized protein n=1 Tax=Chitinophaga cymbidii TaxID=1096750 RepID=A0A512RPQ9_9BACT|nr:hypothetical protein [Chitinophaga cymbidii]GEP97677.1 hypothetical protein CCY01nite_39370 [Chitinophaga cymbidii]
MNNKKNIEELESMIGKTFQYAGQIHFVKNVKMDEVNDKYTIITNLSSFDRKLESIKSFLEYWKPTSNISELVQETDKNQQLTVLMEQDNDLSKKLIDTLTDNIERVKENPDYIPQAQTINNSVNSIVGVTKMRLDLLKYLQSGAKR